MFIFGESSSKFQMYNKQKANGVLTRKKSKCHNWKQENAKKVHNGSETSTYNQRKEKIERGCEEEKEGSPISIFPPLNFRIVRILTGWMAFYSKVSTLWGKHGWLIFELKKEFYIEFRVLLMIGFLVVEEAFISHDTNLVSWLGLLLFRKSLTCF